jgi:hypothetical protein
MVAGGRAQATAGIALRKQIGAGTIKRMNFELVGPIEEVSIIAKGVRIRERKRLWKIYGKGSWRKLKGICRIKLKYGAIIKAELHRYEAHGIGKKEYKIKRIITEEE